jgi:hypothetical protein
LKTERDIKHEFMKSLSSTTYWTYKYIKMIKQKTEEQSLSLLYTTGISKDMPYSGNLHHCSMARWGYSENI